jgi:hypothetical protein
MVNTRECSLTAHFLTSFECPNYFAGGILKECTETASCDNPMFIAANSGVMTFRGIGNDVYQNLYTKLISYLTENSL